MPKFRFAKLVRDKIVAQQLANGSRPVYHYLPTEEHKRALVDKLYEEARELENATPEEAVAELADLQQVLDDLARLYKVSSRKIAAAKAAKKARSGAFRKGIFVESVAVDGVTPG